MGGGVVAKPLAAKLKRSARARRCQCSGVSPQPQRQLSLCSVAEGKILMVALNRFPVLKTKRLFLREMAEGDVEAYARLLADKNTVRYILDGRPLAAEEVPLRIRRNRAHSQTGQHYYWSIEDSASASFVGFIALHEAQAEKPVLSYAVLPKWRRRGIASEAIGAVMNFAKAELGATAVLARTHPDNSASLGLLRALNFEEVGLVRTPWGERIEFLSAAT